MGDMHDAMGWWMLFAAFGFILFWAVLIGLVVWIVNQFSRRAQEGQRDSALDILCQRYARGELSKDDFERIWQEIARR